MLKRDALLDALRHRPLSVADLADWTDDTPQRVRALIAHHRPSFRIVAWSRQPRHITALWGPADGKPDAPKPRPLSGRQKQARYREPRRALLAAKARSAPASVWGGLL